MYVVCKDSIEGTFDIAVGGNLMTKEGNVHTTMPRSNLYYVKSNARCSCNTSKLLECLIERYFF